MTKKIIVLFIFMFTSKVLMAANPVVIMQTNMGEITIELYPEKAPKTVNNFLNYVNDGFYNDTVFHRVIANFMIQGGGFTTDFEKKTTKAPVMNEAFNGLKNTHGAISMARTSRPHSATSQFFINSKNNAFLNFSGKTRSGWGYTVFGNVIKGLDIVDKISSSKTKRDGMFQNLPEKNIIISTIKLQELETEETPQ